MKKYGESLSSCDEVNEANLKGCMLYYSNYVTFYKKQNYGHSKRMIVVTSLGVRAKIELVD